MAGRKIEKGKAIEVMQVENGYLVMMPYELSRGENQPIESSYVFSSFASLADWMREHFDFRATTLKADD